jgi:uncharacterized protein (UPF0332 family)
MPYDRNDLIKISIEKAKTALNDTIYSCNDNRLYNAQNRLYYSIFYSVVALAYLYDNITSKHRSLMHWFNKKFVHEEKIFEPYFFQLYKRAYENRHKSDYVFTWKPDKEKIEDDIKNAEVFINLIEKFINEKINL